MRLTFVADENIDKAIVVELHKHHEVIFINGLLKGMDDDVVLLLSEKQNSILITADKDFGELVFRQQQLHSGIILCRLHGMPPEQKAILVVSLVQKYGKDLLNSFTVIQPNNIRIRKKST